MFPEGTWEQRLGISPWEPDNMTICIAAICDNGRGIVLVADREVGIQFTSGEMIGKFLPLFGDHSWGREWAAGISGTATNATDVIGAVRSKASSAATFSAQQVRNVVEEGYRRVRLSRAEALYLANRGLNLKDFYNTGAAKLSPSTYAQIDVQIAAFNFNTDLIFAGFGEEDIGPSIMTITNPGVTVDHTVLGFWCVGSGATAAQVSLFNREYTLNVPPEFAAYYLFEAKIAAQKASGVGGRTDIHLMRKRGMPISLGKLTTDVLQEIYDELKPRIFEQRHYDKLRATSEFSTFTRLP
jgi:hypothetical protein